jgi:Zn-dependent protease/CBS domain-containing protein
VVRVASAIQVFTVAGIPIRIHASWLVIYALITWTLAVGYFPRVLPEVSALGAWLSGLVAALLLFVSVLLHELSHSFVARAHGLAVRGITLHVFGGVSELGGEPRTPRAELLIAAVGPLTSFATAGVLALVRAAGLMPAGAPAAIVTYLIFVNVAVGVFNLVPGFPLDGGRLLRAAVWRWTGDLGRATYAATRVGSGVALAFMGLGLLQLMTGGVVGGVWLILIGFFLRGAADTSYAQVALRETLGRLAVGDLMTRRVVSVRPDATVADLVDLFWAHHVTSFPVVANGANGGVEGIVTVHQVHTVPRQRWALARVRDIMRPVDEELTIAPAATAVAALERASRNRLGRLAVVDHGRLVGYLSLKDLVHALTLRRPADHAEAAGASTARPAA